MSEPAICRVFGASPRETLNILCDLVHFVAEALATMSTNADKPTDEKTLSGASAVLQIVESGISDVILSE